MDHVIVTEKLCKAYGSHSVLKELDLRVPSASLVGFLGPNGAGKTTTIRILLSLLNASSGTVKVLGQDIKSRGRSIRRRIGYLPGDVRFYSGITGGSTLRHLARMRKQNCDQEIQRLADQLELPLNRTVRKYSTGMRQKLGLIQALMHRPELLILDEPTSGLDPLVRSRIFEELRIVVREGRSVLFSSHSLSEVEELCDHVIILRSGIIVEDQAIEVLRGRALRKVRITFAESANRPEFPDSFRLISEDGRSVTGTWSDTTGQLIEWLRHASLEDVFIERPDLNDLFMTYYRQENRTESANEVG